MSSSLKEFSNGIRCIFNILDMLIGVQNYAIGGLENYSKMGLIGRYVKIKSVNIF